MSRFNDYEEMFTRRVSHMGLREGSLVRYIPRHANGNIDHPDCQNGVVSSIGNDVVFVRYGIDGVLQDTAQATEIGMLRVPKNEE